jgi:hypothetical protein
MRIWINLSRKSKFYTFLSKGSIISIMPTHVALSFDEFRSISWHSMFFGSYTVFTICFSNFLLFWPEYHWRDLSSRNVHLMHQHWFRISFTYKHICYNGHQNSWYLTWNDNEKLTPLQLPSLSKNTNVRCKTNTFTKCVFRVLKSLQWCIGRKKWKSEKKMWKLKEPSDGNQTESLEIEPNPWKDRAMPD